MINTFTMSPVRAKFVDEARKIFGDVKTIDREMIKEVMTESGMAMPYWITDGLQVSRGVYWLPFVSFNKNADDEFVGTVDGFIKTPAKETRKGASPKAKTIKAKIADAPEVATPTPAPFVATPVVSAPALSVGVEPVADSLVFTSDPNFVPWGHFKDIKKVMKSKVFHPMFITGLSGNGKTKMVEQAAAELKRELFNVAITEETDEDDLIGGFRLVDGNTVWSDGPVVRAMEKGAVLLLDELDRGDHKMMCLQAIIEGKPVYLKKAGRLVRPAKGFNVFATANTKGKGDDSGMFAGTNILNEAFLERFPLTLEQPYPTMKVEGKILTKWMSYSGVELNADNEKFVQNLVDWGEVARKAYFNDSIDDVITTRRLLHIITCLSIFNSREKAIEMTTARFDAESQKALGDLWIAISNPPVTMEGSSTAPSTDDDIDLTPF